MIKSLISIDEKKISNLLNIDEVVQVVKGVFRDLNTKKICSPKKYSLVLPGNSPRHMKWINSMPAYLTTEKVVGIKWASICSNNSAKNLPNVNAVILLNHLETGIPFAILDAELITHYRTAASILLAAIRFAPKNPKVAAIIGPGQEGSYAALFLQHKYKFTKFNVISRTEESYLKFKKFMKKHFSNSVEIVRLNDAADVVYESDIIISASTAMQPILDKNSFSKMKKTEQFICGLTAFNDISPAILKYIDNIIFDDGENTMRRIEEVSKVDFSRLNFKNIYHMASPQKVKKKSGINFYLPIGVAAMDIALATYFYKKFLKEK